MKIIFKTTINTEINIKTTKDLPKLKIMIEFAEYFKPKSKKDSVKSETPFGKQAQFDWKEKLNFTFKNDEKFIFNV